MLGSNSITSPTASAPLLNLGTRTQERALLGGKGAAESLAGFGISLLLESFPPFSTKLLQKNLSAFARHT